MKNGLDAFEENLVSKFSNQKFAAFQVSIIVFINWLWPSHTTEGLNFGLLLSRESILGFLTFLLCISSWYLNLRAEVTWLWELDYRVTYAMQAVIQDFVMWFCVGILSIYNVPAEVSIWWLIAGCLAVALFLANRVRAVFRTSQWVNHLTTFKLVPPEATAYEKSARYALSIIIRHVAFIYAIYFMIITC